MNRPDVFYCVYARVCVSVYTLYTCCGGLRRRAMVIADNERRVRRQPLNHLEEKPQYKSRSEKFELDVLPQTNEELM